MEEKKTLKINVLTISLLLVIIILIGYICIEKINSKRKIEDLENKINTISQTFTFSTNAKDSNVSNSDGKIEFSNTEIKKAISDYLNIFVGWGSTDEILCDLGLMKNGEYNNVNVTDDNYKKTNIKYSDFENIVEKYMTKEWFEKINAQRVLFKNIDGIVYYNDVGLTGTKYVIGKVEIKGDYSDKSYIATGYSENVDGSKNEEIIEFHIENNNGKCIISYVSNSDGKIEFSNTEIKKVISDYLNIFVGWGSTDEILCDLGLMKNGEYNNVNVTDDNYKKTNIKYSDFENIVEKYMTKEWFEKINAQRVLFKNIDGIVYYNDVGLTGTKYVIGKVEIKGDYSDKSYIATGYSENVDGSKNEEVIEFHIENNNGKCIISYCD